MLLLLLPTLTEEELVQESVHPEAEADGVEGVGTHLGPRPVSKPLPVGDVQDGFVGPAVEGFSSTLQKDFLLTAASGEQRQQGRSCEHTSHLGRREVKRRRRRSS